MECGEAFPHWPIPPGIRITTSFQYNFFLWYLVIVIIIIAVVVSILFINHSNNIQETKLGESNAPFSMDPYRYFCFFRVSFTLIFINFVLICSLFSNCLMIVFQFWIGPGYRLLPCFSSGI